MSRYRENRSSSDRGAVKNLRAHANEYSAYIKALVEQTVRAAGASRFP
jgi:hypothetical protein